MFKRLVNLWQSLKVEYLYYCDTKRMHGFSYVFMQRQKSSIMDYGNPSHYDNEPLTHEEMKLINDYVNDNISREEFLKLVRYIYKR